MAGESAAHPPQAGKHVSRSGFDARLAGQRAECDGGAAIPGTRLAGREEFAGRLTGAYVDHGDPPWRWYRLGDLTRKPPGYPVETVWCEAESLFLIDARGRASAAPLPRPAGGR